MSIPDEKRIEAQEKIDALHRANVLGQLIQTEGWKLIFGLQEAAVEKSRVALRGVNTADVPATIDAVQRWQIAENLLAFQVDYINRTLADAEAIQGSVTLDDALLMEQLRNDKSGTGDPGRPDPTGH